ncbi:MAG: hypothetical protein HY940_06840 [Gammaproteobacteria bacterium]|nr:hypothetical protein [Gammaproteobacteria bacterium]
MAQKPRYARGAVAILAGCLINFFGDMALGVNIELFWGLQTFDALWFIDMFVVPLIAGLVVGLIFGLGGKWLCYFPPLIVRLFSYFYLAKFAVIPDGASLMPMGWWGFFVILTIEAAAFGGVAGEIMIKKTYGRMPRHLYHKDQGRPDSDKPES